jgi:hypothetical protein
VRSLLLKLWQILDTRRLWLLKVAFILDGIDIHATLSYPRLQNHWLLMHISTDNTQTRKTTHL